MRIRYTIAHAFITTGLTETLLTVWEIWRLGSIPEAFYSSAALMFFYGLFSGVITLVLWGRIPQLIRVVISVLTGAFLTTFALAMYPQLGFTMEWYILLGVILFSALIATVVLWGFGKEFEVIEYDEGTEEDF